VRDDIAVRVADEPAVPGEDDPGEDERHPVSERVCVDADPDANLTGLHLEPLLRRHKASL
jgi:hypothetical protein